MFQQDSSISIKIFFWYFDTCSYQNMEMTKSKKLLKKTKKEIFGDFFRYDVIQETYFQQFFIAAFKQSENQTLKISSQEIFKKKRKGIFAPPPK